MAKIALISYSVSQEVLALAKALRAQQNEVVIISNKLSHENQESILSKLTIQLLTPFKKWNAIEAVKLFPRLLTMDIDIFHFVFSDRNEKIKWAHWILAQMIQPFPKKILVCSFYYPTRKKNNFQLRELIRLSHILTWGTRAYLMEAKRDFKVSEHKICEVLPPIIDSQILIDEINTKSSIEKELNQLICNISPFIFIPTTFSEFKNSFNFDIFSFDHKFNFLFLGERPSNSLKNNRFFYLNSKKYEDITFVLKHASSLLIAFSDLSIIEVEQYKQITNLYHVPLIIRQTQNVLLPGLVQNNKNGWILEKSESSLNDLILNNPNLKLNYSDSSRPKYEVYDSIINELNRMYLRALTMRS